MNEKFGIEHFADLTVEQFEVVWGWVTGRMARGPKMRMVRR